MGLLDKLRRKKIDQGKAFELAMQMLHVDNDWMFQRLLLSKGEQVAGEYRELKYREILDGLNHDEVMMVGAMLTQIRANQPKHNAIPLQNTPAAQPSPPTPSPSKQTLTPQMTRILVMKDELGADMVGTLGGALTHTITGGLTKESIGKYSQAELNDLEADFSRYVEQNRQEARLLKAIEEKDTATIKEVQAWLKAPQGEGAATMGLLDKFKSKKPIDREKAKEYALQMLLIDESAERSRIVKARGEQAGEEWSNAQIRKLLADLSNEDINMINSVRSEVMLDRILQESRNMM